MKTLLTMIGVALMATSCKESPDTKAEELLEVSAEDVAWATGWNVYKWETSKLPLDPIRAVALVVVGPDGQVIQEIGPVGMTDAPTTNDGEITVAFRKDGKKAHLRLRYLGSSISSETKDIFNESHWGYSANHKIIGDLLVFATDSDSIPLDPSKLMELKSNKLCLRFLTR